MLRPTIIFTVIISTIGGLQFFTEPYLFEPVHYGATGGSDRQYQTVAMYLYEKAFGAASSSSATPRRSRGACSCSSP